MPIKLINLYSTRNIGDAAIAAGLASMSPDGVALGHIPDRDPLPVPGLCDLRAETLQLPRISVGGDIFNNSRPWLMTRRFFQNVQELRRDADRTAIFGQSIPRSCKGLAYSLLTSSMRKIASVTVRDEESWRRLKSASVDASLAYDAAFALEPSGNRVQAGTRILDALGVDATRAALFSLRGFDAMYPHDEAAFLKNLSQALIRLALRGHQCGILIQADAEGADSDVAIARKLKESGLPIAIVDLVRNHKGDPIGELMSVLAAANIVVAVRYHTAVLRLIAGRQPLVISYSNKTRDLIDRLGLIGLDIEDADPRTLVGLAEATSGLHFDASGIRRSVRSHFIDALQRIAGMSA